MRGMYEGAQAIDPDTTARARRAELRIYVHALVSRFYFYLPVLVHHMEGELTRAGASQPGALSLSLIGVISIGMIIAEYPSGVMADWLGCARTLLVAGGLQLIGVLFFLVPGSLAALLGAQVFIGVATAFRSGSDTALLHAQLERMGEGARYGGGLARLRFFNTLAIGLAGMMGGVLYSYWPPAVFIASVAMGLIGMLCLLGLEEVRGVDKRSYRQVLTESLSEMRRNRRVQALMLLGGLGNPFFVFAYWVTQRYLIDADFTLLGMGVTVASISLLQAATMPLSAWISRHERRLTLGLIVVVVMLPVTFAAVAEAWGRATELGALLLVAVAGCHVLFRNIVNVRLQRLVPSDVRASVVSFEAWIGALGYLALFPFGGFLIATRGISGAFWVLSLLMAASLWPLARVEARTRR